MSGADGGVCHRQAARSAVETRRINGKILHKHVASFGYAPLPLIVPDRIQFWTRMRGSGFTLARSKPW
jgi:hypothetical protein